jgi:histidinol dehydrogenase
VLPTGGSARHSACLSVLPFLRLVNVIECSKDALAATLPPLAALGAAEDLPAHVAAVTARFEDGT